MKKLCMKIIALCLVTFAVVLFLFYSAYFLTPSSFSDSYQKGFNYQYYALKHSDDKPKIMVLGGSYMTFATNTRLLSDMAKRPAYTLGIHGGMGMSYILETAMKFIKEGDIVVYSFRPFAKDDYGMDLIYLCFENDKELFLDFLKSHPWTVIKTFPSSIYTKAYNIFHAFVRKNVFNKESVYSAKAFDKNTGNLIYPRPGIDKDIPESEFEPRFTYDISEIEPSCIKSLNDLDAYCKNQGAQLFICFSPAYEGSVISTEASLKQYEEFISKALSAPILSSIHKNLFPKDCVYNGALHLNDIGAEKYTKQMYEDIEKHILSTP